MYEKNYLVLNDFLIKQYPNSCIEFIGSGWSSIVFLVDNFIFRFPKQNMCDYEHELNVCCKLSNYISFEVPEIEIVSTLKYPFAKHRCLEGSVWDTECIEKSKIKLAYDCALFLAQIHNFQSLTQVRQSPVSKKLDIGTVEKSLFVYFKGYVLNTLCREYEIGSMCLESNDVFIHADFHPSNAVLDNNGRLKGIFDWCNSGVGERARDFIHLYNSMDKHFFDALLCEYSRCCGVYVDIDRVRRLALIDLITKLYWANKESKFTHNLLEKIERIIL